MPPILCRVEGLLQRAQGGLCGEEAADGERHQSVRLMSAGAGVLCPAEEDKEKAAKEGELMYMRATYERVVGSRDSVSYHLINPGGGASGIPPQEFIVFLLRTD